MAQLGEHESQVVAADTRVILVGRTGLDGALRLDPGLELVPVRTPVDAVGELASPMHCDATVNRAVVVVSREVEESLRSLTQHDETRDSDRLAKFVRGLRLAEPAVKILGVTRPDAKPTSKAPEFDGVVSAGWDPSSLARYIRGGGDALDPVSPATGEPAAVAVHAGGVASIVLPSEMGDLAMVALVLRGQDPLACAVETLRARLGDPSIVFLGADAPPPAGSAKVAWDEVVLGSLSAGTTRADLAPHAKWLAGWLRLRDQHAQLRIAAFTDPLTGAWNRRYFDRHLDAAMEQARQRRQSVTILLFDIDDFKKYNDQYGHEAGDEILVEAVKLMRSVIRPSDRVCRIGGDEFAVVFYDPEGPRQEGSRNTVSVVEVARRFQRQIVQHRFPKLSGCAPGTLSISGGMATFPWDGATAQELLSKADQLALSAKNQGKNAITFGPGTDRICGGDSE